MVWLLSVEWMFCHLWSGSAGEEEENTPACWGGGRGVQGECRGDKSLSVSSLSCGLSVGKLWGMEYLLTDMWRGHTE